MVLANNRDTKQRGAGVLPEAMALPVAAATTIYQGSMVALNAAGYAVPASADSALRVIGRAEQKVVNAGSAGDEKVLVKRGVFRFANSGTTGEVTAADIGKPCYVVDDETVSRISAAGARPAAGRVFDVSSAGVDVQLGDFTDEHGNIDVLMIAGSNLTAAQFLPVALAADGEVDLVATAGGMITGLLQNAPAAAAVAIVRVAGVSKWIASGVINPGVALAASVTTGKSKAAVVSDAAAVGSNAFAIALTAGATDTAHSVLIARQGLLPATAA